MIDFEQRMLRLSAGKRLPVRLDDATWTAVDWLASESGRTWSEWCSTVVGGCPDSGNVTATIRNAAMTGILNATILADRVAFSEYAGPTSQSLNICDNAEFHDVLAQTSIKHVTNFGGFGFAAGIHDGCVCFAIKNNLQDRPNIVISTPFTDNQWMLGMEARK